MSPARRVRISLTVYAFVILVGFVGYQLLEGLGPLDALYMTIITVTTVGFREVSDLGWAGKAFTIALIVAGVVSATYAALSAAEFFIEGHFRRLIERRRMERKIGRLEGHIIVCGYGRVGRHLVHELGREGVAFVVVDDDESKIGELVDAGYLAVFGDATEEHVLQEAGLQRARALVAAVNTDADNVLITLTAKGLRPDLTVIGRTKADENEAKLRRAGADRVIAPTTIGGRRIAQILTRPVVADFLDGLGPGGIDYTLEEVPIVPEGPLRGATLREAAIRERYGCTVLAVRRAGTLVTDTHPTAESVLHPGDVLVVLGTEADVMAMRDQLTTHRSHPRG
ncbi:MAG: potassium channel protein [Actinomycetota bacterium]|nr:potassium channel protein [Actinomycetota bacterium]